MQASERKALARTVWFFSSRTRIENTFTRAVRTLVQYDPPYTSAAVLVCSFIHGIASIPFLCVRLLTSGVTGGRVILETQILQDAHDVSAAFTATRN